MLSRMRHPVAAIRTSSAPPKQAPRLRLLAHDIGALELTDLHRFTHPDEAAATLALRHGDPAAIDHYEKRGRLHAGPRVQDELCRWRSAWPGARRTRASCWERRDAVRSGDGSASPRRWRSARGECTPSWSVETRPACRA